MLPTLSDGKLLTGFAIAILLIQLFVGFVLIVMLFHDAPDPQLSTIYLTGPVFIGEEIRDMFRSPDTVTVIGVILSMVNVLGYPIFLLIPLFKAVNPIAFAAAVAAFATIYGLLAYTGTRKGRRAQNPFAGLLQPPAET